MATDGVEMIVKPAVVEAYNQNMGGVDKGKCTNKIMYFNLPHVYL